MINSNKPIGRSVYSPNSNFGAKSVMADLSTIENAKVRKQVRDQQKAVMMGKAEQALSSAKRLNLASNANAKPIKPLVRKTNARDFAND